MLHKRTLPELDRPQVVMAAVGLNILALKGILLSELFYSSSPLERKWLFLLARVLRPTMATTQLLIEILQRCVISAGWIKTTTGQRLLWYQS